MPMPRNDRLCPEAVAILSAARVCEMRDRAAELAKLATPPPRLHIQANAAGYRKLLLALAAERRRSAKLLALLAE